uniref:AF4/FMR2 C-terminal homology domain-containing protein n=1 Tax=Tetraodon nigroviridis TaxID=99883 RepID=H3CQ12_TETNG
HLPSCSEYNEERKLLRLRAWEQRNQGTSQAKDQENMPLFGEPYKTNKGDELSNLIQRMLGSYEDVNHPNPAAMEPFRIPTYASFSQSDQGQTSLDGQAGPPFHTQASGSQSQKAPGGSGVPSQSSRTSGAASSPDHQGNSSPFSNASLNPSQLSYAVPCHQRSEDRLRDHARLAQEARSHSPPAKPLSLQCSGDLGTTGANTKEACDHHPRITPSECPGFGDASALVPRDSTKDSCLPQASKGHSLPSQTFPSLLSKQPSVVMTQKPTAYVRPMDGQDQVVTDSPELKPSPEPYGPLPELITKPLMETDRETLPPYLEFIKLKLRERTFTEMRPNEAQCVEAILREMTCSWPPILTALNTPNSDEPSKSPSQPRGAEHVSSHPGQRNRLNFSSQTVVQNQQLGFTSAFRSDLSFLFSFSFHLAVLPEKCDTSAADASQQVHRRSSCSFKVPHSRGLESTSSSDSESSSRSDSDSESAAEEPPKCPRSGPAAKHVDWQLGNWIRSSQQNCHAEGHCGPPASESPGPPPSRCAAEAVEPSREAKPRQEFTENAGKPLTYGARLECRHQEPVRATVPSPTSGLSSCSHKHSRSPNPSSSAKAGSVHTAASVKCEKVEDRDRCPTVRPKVKTKMGPSRKNKERCDTKKAKERTSKHESHDKCEAGPESEVALVSYGHCPSCGVQYPKSCSCAPHSPAQPGQLSPAPPIRFGCATPKSDTVPQKGTKVPPKITPGHLDKTRRGLRDSRRCPRSLLVRIDLSLLSKVPQVSRNHRESLCKRKKASVVQPREGRSREASAAPKLGKSSKKSHHVKLDIKGIPKKKPRLENHTSSSHACGKLNGKKGLQRQTRFSGIPAQEFLQAQDQRFKEAKGKRREAHGGPPSSRQGDLTRAQDSMLDSMEPPGSKPFDMEPLLLPQELAKSSAALPWSSSPTRKAWSRRPLLRWEDRQFPVNHYIKEAKKLKHKADAESDKLCKAFSYVDAAMYFVESGIAMERDHQTSVSSYTMLAETVELLKFVLKLKNSVDASAPPSEKDFVALCLKCQSLLHMAMFRHKQKAAVKYSKTLTDHFSNSAQRTQSPLVSTPKVSGTPSPMPSLPSPAPSSAGACSSHSGDPVSSFVSVPQAIEQVAFSYVNITSLFLRAYEIWEKAEELARAGSGLLTELDTALGPLNLMSSMAFMVRYTRQGVHWLRLDCRRG